MSNNLIILYDNLVDISSSTLTVSSTTGATNKENLRNNTKSSVWRSVGTTATLLATFASASNVKAVVLPFCNLTSTATIRIRGFSSNPTLSGTTVVGGTQVWDSGVLDACPWETSLLNSYAVPPSLTSYAYGGGKYARAYYYNTSTVTSITVEIVDPSNTAGYVELSRLVIGDYWSPRFNTSYGISLDVVDTSSSDRMDSGDVSIVNSPKYTRLTFDLKYMDSSDRIKMLQLLRSNGYAKPMFVSIFPEHTEAYLERDYQIFGRLSGSSPIVHPIYSMYSTQVNIEEI